MRAEEIPPGVQEVILPSGERALAYSTGPTNPQPTSAAPAAPVAQPIPAWAKSTALLAPTIGAGIGMAAVGLSTAVPGLIAMSHALWAAAALLATGGTAAAVVVGRVRARITAAPQATQRPHITQYITATGLFGRANGTINHR
ncbi:hypothetical protein HXP44_21735 [Streptomyces sioyaensis]|uniref:Uncharacterized protein n=1 Tax=Streptomyces sioyaensis TaxID=67364 RepID=A0A4Q1QPS7_9ACTN|nr:hypothetical protein [Streptomyces sioyaensis]MBM4794612.1 hypothetical protein [Streptomyces sioyaensis]RXS62290.1 hypothetical protein EST54_25530 [Streptomyces sioyaensis]